MKTTIEEINDEIYEGLLEDIRARKTINVNEEESITREKAIERLKNYTQYRCSGEDLEALNVAVQALEQEPKTKHWKSMNIPRKTLEKILDEAYDNFCELESGESYIMIHGKRVCTDVGYALEGIGLFIDFVTGRAEHKTYDE